MATVHYSRRPGTPPVTLTSSPGMDDVATPIPYLPTYAEAVADAPPPYRSRESLVFSPPLFPHVENGTTQQSYDRLDCAYDGIHRLQLAFLRIRKCCVPAFLILFGILTLTAVAVAIVAVFPEEPPNSTTRNYCPEGEGIYSRLQLVARVCTTKAIYVTKANVAIWSTTPSTLHNLSICIFSCADAFLRDRGLGTSTSGIRTAGGLARTTSGDALFCISSVC
uniref:ORF0 n=1 Tax=Human herpesvirus 3 TaxID=10335 RepID=A0A1B1JGP9_HHV3|nr:ORF0 [Human alphaherpesvirus 3]